MQPQHKTSASYAEDEQLTDLPPVPPRIRHTTAVAPVTGKPLRFQSASASQDSQEDKGSVSIFGMRFKVGGRLRRINLRLGNEENDDQDDKIEKREEEGDEVGKNAGTGVSNRSGRLTRRQRAMHGETLETGLDEFKSRRTREVRKGEDNGNETDAELKRQQRVRLRQIITEKRNKERRAAMAEKVLKGVTSKRRRLTKANEQLASEIGKNLRSNEMRKGCVRVISNRRGVSLSIPHEVEVPAFLKASVKAVYPPRCERDPKTGKRILV